MIFRRFPYTTLNDINLDWIIKQVKQIASALQGKQDKPDSAGAAGQVLGLDENLDPVWLDQSGGTGNYNNLTNKPQINSVTLSGNKTAADLGLANASDIPTVPVQSVNGQTGAVELDAADVGALPGNTFIPGYSLQLPVMDGEASAGTTYARYSMEGHRHPTDTSRASAAELATFMRPNLLDNWYFVKGGGTTGDYGVFPVNQRGQVSYMNSGYGIDRWNNRSAPTVTISNGGIDVSGGTDYKGIYQTVDSKEALLNKTVTITAWITALSGGSARIALGNSPYKNTIGTVIGDVSTTSPGVWSATFEMPASYSQPYLNFTVSADVAVSFSIAAVKLELGGTQTLAHQENGAWVLNEIPRFDEQIRKCQMYLQKIGAYNMLRACQINAGSIDFLVPCNMVSDSPTLLDPDTQLQVAEITSTATAISGFTFSVRTAEKLALGYRVRATKSNHGLTDAVLLTTSKPWYLSCES